MPAGWYRGTVPAGVVAVLRSCTAAKVSAVDRHHVPSDGPGDDTRSPGFCAGQGGPEGEADPLRRRWFAGSPPVATWWTEGTRPADGWCRCSSPAERPMRGPA